MPTMTWTMNFASSWVPNLRMPPGPFARVVVDVSAQLGPNLDLVSPAELARRGRRVELAGLTYVKQPCPSKRGHRGSYRRRR